MHIVYVLAPYGGPEAYVKTLLPYLECSGHRVSIVYASRPQAQRPPFPDHITIRYAPPDQLHYYLGRAVGSFRGWPLRMRAIDQARALCRAIAEIHDAAPVDLVEVTEGFMVTPLRRRWAVVVRAHGSDWTVRHFCADGTRHHDRWLIRTQARQLRAAHAVSAISSHLADHLSQFCAFPRQLIQTIPYPIDLELFRPAHSADDNPATAIAVMAAGRLEPRKGVHLLVQAMRFVWKHAPETLLYLVGSEAGFTGQMLRDMSPPEHRDKIIFPGFVAHNVLPNLYRSLKVYVAPTQYETFGYTILEAMACGLPVIASDVGAIPELVEHGANGLLVPFGDVQALGHAIEMLLAQPALHAQMSSYARHKAMRYALDTIGRSMEQFYVDALARSGRRRVSA